MNRRSLLKLSLASAATLGMPLRLRAAPAGKITAINITPFSGALADLGIDTEYGAKVAVDDIKKEFGLDIEYIRVDSESNPSVAVRKMQEAVAQHKARFFFGANLSSEALALGKEAQRNDALYMTSAGADEITGTDCNEHVYRWAVPTFGAAEQTLRPFLKLNPNAKRWYAITPKYVFGESLLRNSENIIKENGGQLVGNSFHSLTEREFSSYLANAAAANPDVLLLLNFSAQAVQALRQAASFGIKRNMKILVAWSAGLDQLQALSPAVTEGVYFGAQYWHTEQTPRNRAFVEAMQSRYKRMPNNNSGAGYAMLYALGDAIAKAGTTDTAAVIKAMNQLRYDGLTGAEYIRASDHEMIKSYYLLRGKAAKDMANRDDLAEVLSKGTSYIEPEKSLCKGFA